LEFLSDCVVIIIRVHFPELLILLLFGVFYVRATDNICAGLGLETPKFLKSPNGTCSDYVTCWKGVAYPQTCSAGLFFDPEREQCLPDESVCHKFSCTPGAIEKFPMEGKCVEYILCVDGTQYNATCGDGLYFSPQEKDCVPKEESGCIVNRCDSASTDLQIYEHEFNCTKYFICVKGKPWEQTCAKGTHFDKNLKKCVAGECPVII
jgi:hypothetical protein